MADRNRTESGTRHDRDTRPRAGVAANRVRAPRSLRRLGALALMLGAIATVAAAAAQAGGIRTAAAGRWRIQRTPDPARAQISVLASVACSSKHACTAVGSSSKTSSSPTLTLAERWNGRRWRIQHTPSPKGTSDVLFGVACPSERSCIAVGNAFHMVGRRTTALVEAWNGRHWRVRSVPTIGAFSTLQAVSCTSARACTAVGFYHGSGGQSKAMVERWNGRTWRIQSIPLPYKTTQLLGVSCPRAHACTAVGSRTNGTGDTRALAESWNGRTWRVRAVPLPHGAPVGILEAVSCTSPTACTATGTDFAGNGPTLAERWNARAWHVERTPNPSNYRQSVGEVALDGVSCMSARACTASGDYSPGGAAAYFIESWNGRQWRMKAVPHPSGFVHGALLGVSCAHGRCTAVGGYTGRVRIQLTLAMTS